MPESWCSPAYSSYFVSSVQQKTIHELWLYCWKRGNTRGIERSIGKTPPKCLFSLKLMICLTSWLRSCIMWKSRARLWVTSSTAASTSSPRTSFSTSVPFSRRTSRTCCCESQLVFLFCGLGSVLGKACKYHVLIWFGCLHLFSPPSIPWFLFPYTIISYPFDG